MPVRHQANHEAAPMSERRAFFLAVLRREEGGASTPARSLAARQIALLRQVAARTASALPRGAAPAISIGRGCLNHGSCVAVCPTGALRTYEDGGRAGVEFHAGACIGCGVCSVVCPESALALEADVGPASDAVRILSNHAQRECARCDNAFVVSGDEELCPACRKDVSLFANGFSMRSDAA